MFRKEDIIRVTNHEGYRKCLIIPGFLQSPDFYEDEAEDMPYRIVDIVDLRWNDREMTRDKMQLNFTEGLYIHIQKVKYDVIYVHGISDSIIYKLMLYGSLNIPVVFMCPYCLPEEIREKHYDWLRTYLKFQRYIPAKMREFIFKKALNCDDSYFALYLLDKLWNIKPARVISRFEDSLISIEQTQELEGIYLYSEFDRYSWPDEDDSYIEGTGHYPFNEEFRATLHNVEIRLSRSYNGKESRHA